MKRKKLIKRLKKKIKRCVSIPFIHTGMNIRFDDISLIDENNKLSIMSHNILYKIKNKHAIKLKKYILKHYRIKTK
jgi:hypothetical protein